MRKSIFTISLAILLFIASSSCAWNGSGSHGNATDMAGVALPQEKNTAVIEIDKAQFLEKVYDYQKNSKEWVYEGSLPCIVDFYANWCGPCRTLSSTLEKLAQEYKGKIVIYKVNVDKESELSALFGISSIPALLWCPLGSEPFFTQGAVPEAPLREKIETSLIK